MSGNKPQLIERIETFLIRREKATLIKSKYRGYLVRKSFQLRGEGFRHREKCVNETDFFTLEPLVEIPFERFFSYTDEKDFTYGFDLFSLVQYYKKMGNVMNPYNRCHFTETLLERISLLNYLVRIIFPDVYFAYKEEERKLQSSFQNTELRFIRPSNYIQNPIQGITYTELYEKHRRIQNIQNKPLETRIQELFIEIDALGNYTQSSWFLNLGKDDLVRFFVKLHRHWHNRNALPPLTRDRIACIRPPFLEIDPNLDFHLINLEETRRVCIHVMEYFVFTGINEEDRRLGCMHLLSVLTLVSNPTRMALPWLYDALVDTF